MEIVNGSWPSNRVMCPHCHCVFDVSGHDLKSSSFGGYHVHCPGCRDKVDLKGSFWHHLWYTKNSKDAVAWAECADRRAKDSYRERQRWDYLRSL